MIWDSPRVRIRDESEFLWGALIVLKPVIALTETELLIENYFSPFVQYPPGPFSHPCRQTLSPSAAQV